MDLVGAAEAYRLENETIRPALAVKGLLDQRSAVKVLATRESSRGWRVVQKLTGRPEVNRSSRG